MDTSTNTESQLTAPKDAKDDWRSPALLLMLMAAAMQLAFASWNTLMNNFAVNVLSFTGQEIGIQQSIREIPGFLSFAAVFLLFAMREQTLAMISLLLLGAGVAATGYFPTAMGFYITTFIGSVGFHYYETMHQSLTLQWLPKKTAPITMGKILKVAAFAQLLAYGLVYFTSKYLGLSFASVFMLCGAATGVIVVAMWVLFPTYPEKVTQHKKLIFRKRYWLYYALTFMSGARRQIFLVFASFMMVERFGFPVHEIASLFIVNSLISMWVAPKIGMMIAKIGERKTLTIEYCGLIVVFTAYAFVQDPWIAAALYIVDHGFFAMAIAQKTYFQKIADPADIAPTTGVAFTINHIAAVVIPITFGLLWLVNPAAVFLAGAGMAVVSLILSRLVPNNPAPLVENIWLERRAVK